MRGVVTYYSGAASPRGPDFSFRKVMLTMFQRSSSIRLYAILAGALAFMATPASAQFVPRTLNDPATGEKYHIEASAGYWSPIANMSIASQSLGIAGSKIDFKKDLGLKDQRFNEMHLILRPGVKHKLRLDYIPIKFEQSATITRNITFNGQIYRIGLPVNSSLSWRAYRFGYEYDFIHKNRGFGGLILEAKYTDVEASLQSPAVQEYAHAKAPIPSIGGIMRFYPVANISITGELTGITIPASLSEQYNAHYADLDIYGTVNFSDNVGAKVGYRRLDVAYVIEKDTGNFVLKGLYFGVVARF